jgi:hypothetical protein
MLPTITEYSDTLLFHGAMKNGINMEFKYEDNSKI